MAERRFWIRRLILPLAIVAVAGGLALLNSHRRAAQADDVHRLVTDLCDDLAAGRDPASHLQATDALITRPLVSRLRSAIDRAGGRPGALVVVAEPGDTPQVGTIGQTATHTAVLSVDGVEVLGLRVVHPGKNGDIAIIGFWTPSPP
ncbi:MAG: hypothetical protein ACYSU7_04905 [Planctomycetota bacterium]|jgi:hypothetical protein